MSVALVLGGAACVWSDIEAALDVGQYDLVVSCNDIGAAWPGRLDAWVSLHPDKFGIWLTRRRQRGYPAPAAVIGHLPARASARLPDGITDFAGHHFEGQRHSGSSGLFALKYALVDLAADTAVLCGVPMDKTHRHFFDERAWTAADAHRRGWLEALPQIKDRARSMSGWTADLLGRPEAG